MKKISLLSVLVCAIFASAPTLCAGQTPQSPCTAQQIRLGPDISRDYLKEARNYRAEGRYELARQSYAKALSTCQSHEQLAVIKRELAGVELLLRTMR